MAGDGCYLLILISRRSRVGRLLFLCRSRPRSSSRRRAATPSTAAGVEDRSGARSSPRVVFVNIVLGVALGIDVVGTKALVADGRLHAKTTNIDLIAGVVPRAVRAADGAALIG